MLHESLNRIGVRNGLFSTVNVESMTKKYKIDEVDLSMKAGSIAILQGGCAGPFFTHDTSLILRALELNADFVIKGTKVDGVFDSDPMENSEARKFDELSYDEVVARDLKIMDMSAITLAKENKLPIVVLKYESADDVLEYIKGGKRGTIVR